MITIFGIPGPLLFGQLAARADQRRLLRMLSLGLAVIFGMLNIINFAHGALFMMGAFASWMLLNYVGIGYFPALILAPLLVGASSASSWRRPSSAGCTSWITCTACC